MDTEEQARFVNYFYTTSGVLSLCGSLTIIYILLQSNRQLDSSYRRLVFGMSVSDVISSGFFAICFIPRRSVLACNIQGFLFHVGVTTTPMYNASLCIYYLVSIFFEKDEQWIKKRLEPFLHGVPIIWNLLATVFLLRSGSINETGVLCWIGPKPMDCLEDPNMECERGLFADKYRWLFVGYQTLLNFLIILISMIMVCVKVASQERKLNRTVAIRRTSRISQSVTEGVTDVESVIFQRPKKRKKGVQQRKAANQALVYVLAYFFPFLFPTIHYAIKSMLGKRSFTTWLLMAIFMPLQGLLNAIVFIRPRFIALRQRHPDLSFIKTLLVTVKFVTLTRESGVSNRLATLGSMRSTAVDINITDDDDQTKVQINGTDDEDERKVPVAT